MKKFKENKKKFKKIIKKYWYQFCFVEFKIIVLYSVIFVLKDRKMKMISKIAAAGMGLALLGSSSAFAQSLDDAKKAIDAEQFQKAKAMLKNLVNTQSTKDENYFYLGWVYVKQDYSDSAKMVFQKGINVNANSALNYAGLGIVARMDKDQNGAKANACE